jgi:hypothetical protein
MLVDVPKVPFPMDRIEDETEKNNLPGSIQGVSCQQMMSLDTIPILFYLSKTRNIMASRSSEGNQSILNTGTKRLVSGIYDLNAQNRR